MFQFGTNNISFLLFPRIKNDDFFFISNLVNIKNSNIFINSFLQHRDQISGSLLSTGQMQVIGKSTGWYKLIQAIMHYIESIRNSFF
jgi:hypothetical protein